MNLPLASHILSTIPLNLTSILFGAFLLGMIVTIYVRGRTLLVRDFGLFILSLFLFVLAAFLQDIQSLTGTNPEWLFDGLVWLINAAAGILYVVMSPYFFFRLFSVKVTAQVRAALLAVNITTVVNAISLLVAPQLKFPALILSAIMFLTISHELALIIAKLFTLNDRNLRTAMLVLVVVTALFFPLMLLDAGISLLPGLADLGRFDGLSRPVYLVLIGGLFAVFAQTYFNRPAFRKGGDLTPYFLREFGITPREKEIIELIASSLTNNEIAEKLFISVKTVENHISSIFRKTSVRSRMQLLEKIRNNSEA